MMPSLLCVASVTKSSRTFDTLKYSLRGMRGRGFFLQYLDDTRVLVEQQLDGREQLFLTERLVQQQRVAEPARQGRASVSGHECKRNILLSQRCPSSSTE